jgi:hypothetical protein
MTDKYRELNEAQDDGKRIQHYIDGQWEDNTGRYWLFADEPEFYRIIEDDSVQA